MEFLDLIRIADSAQDVLQVLGSYVESLQNVDVIPDWCLRGPIDGEYEVRRRTAALLAVVDAASLRLDDRGCLVAKQALNVFAAAAGQLRGNGGSRPPADMPGAARGDPDAGRRAEPREALRSGEGQRGS